MSLSGKTIFITGASRGIGLAIALGAARDGANIVIAAKTDRPHPKLPGTIYTAAEAVERAGGKALPLCVDVRRDEQVAAAIEKAVAEFGGIDIVVNNAGAVQFSSIETTDMRRFDLMHQINARAPFLVSKLALPHLKKSSNPHILMCAPPPEIDEASLAPHIAYSMSKFGMSLLVLGLAGELRPSGIAVNALWPRTTIATAAVRNLLGGEEMICRSRSPEILAEAACRIFNKDARSFTGHFLIDDIFLADEGVTDFDRYKIDSNAKLARSVFVPKAVPDP